MNAHALGNLVGVVGLLGMVLAGVLLGELVIFIKSLRRKSSSVQAVKSVTVEGQHGGSVTINR